MREALFVKQNSEKWQHYDSMQQANPDDVANQFIEITNDLAYSKTFYPNSKTTAYLNGLAAKLHQSVYKNKKEKSNRFIHFWKTELPLIFLAHRKQVFYALFFFLVSCAIGALSAKYDDTFVRLIMGDGYVNMTNENIAKGDPFGVYKQDNEFMMFLKIGSNNIFVALYTFVLGILFSFGSIVSLFRNGIMLGSFQYFFFSKGLGFQSVLVIWIHGTLEISAIVLAGAAGLILGNSFLFPKTYTRMASIQKGAKDGLKIVIGLIPIFIVAAFFESFVTRHTEMPLGLSMLILLSSAAFMIWYVFIYPIKIQRKQVTLD
ncbi:stage II sporulation protein M [Pedobacter alluvionis]|uniref:Putative membrane protein SpoIIM required for sporulation n=1 Tax=Pedobacter alluvionis TaxID=475253 RepID=A0A497Y6E5_9SPHI|nr:stage II sporulation protein M [Pedobacter alluvionis]RLJ77740.1 putative membrane protein SpoIIM required for sporulation [Pedobacter alluvionis]TFB33060.1 stage II sporulation protein M [Pedobacter alluvionis]